MCYIVVVLCDMVKDVGGQLQIYNTENMLKHVLPVCNSVNICTAVSYGRVMLYISAYISYSEH